MRQSGDLRDGLRSRRCVLVLLCAVGVGASGCGRSEDRREVSEVTTSFLRAIAEHDGGRACARLATGAREALEHDQDKRCAAAVTELEAVSPSAVTRAQVFATSAKVDLADGHSAFLELTPNGWRLSAAGCRPEGGDAPYTCEVQG
jgi:hypothetical protein